MFSFLVELFTRIISEVGYWGIMILMALESMVAPVPSEAVMPFAGFLWYQDQMSWWPIIFYSTLGSIIGSLLSYYIGYYLGRPFIVKFGKYFLLNEHHLVWTEKFFEKYGSKTIFVSRFIPVVRHLISIPAGTSRMNIWKFSVYTIIGAGLWNAILTYAGYYLGSNWTKIGHYTEFLDWLVIAFIILGIIYFIVKNTKKNNLSS